MLFFALSVFILGLVSADQSLKIKSSMATMSTYVASTEANATGANATGANTTADNTTADNTTIDPRPTPPFSADSETPGAISVPPVLPTTPRFSPPLQRGANTTRAKPIADDVKPTTTTTIPRRRGRKADDTGIIIISVVAVFCLLIAVGCFIKHKYQRRYSVDLRTEATGVPLNVVVDQTEPGDSTVYNGMQTADNRQVDSKEPKEPKESGPAEDPQPKDSGPTEDPQPMAEQNEQAEQACLVEAGATAQPASPGPAEAGGAAGAAAAADADEGVVTDQTSAESLKEPSEGTGSSAQTEASATDALI